MEFLWQHRPSRALLLFSALLSAAPPSTIASSFVIASSTALVRSSSARTGRFNPLLRVTPGGGGDDSAPDGQQSFGKETTEVAAAYSGVVPRSSTDATAPAVPTMTSLGPNAHSQPGMLRSRFPNFPWHRLPNTLTYARCFAIPLLVCLFYLPKSICGHANLYTGSIFATASATDWLDGYLARRWDISSHFGAFLDPVADKLMVSTSLILLSGRYGAIVAVPTLVILAREIAVSALREWMAQKGARDVVKVGMQGKVKTALTMVALTILLFVPASSSSAVLYKLGIPLLYMSALVTITSGSVYFIAALPALFGSQK